MTNETPELILNGIFRGVRTPEGDRTLALCFNRKPSDREMILINERVRMMGDVEGSLKVIEQALIEVRVAQERGANWYTHGSDGLYRQIDLWVRKGFAAMAKVKSDLFPRLCHCGAVVWHPDAVVAEEHLLGHPDFDSVSHFLDKPCESAKKTSSH